MFAEEPLDDIEAKPHRIDVPGGNAQRHAPALAQAGAGVTSAMTACDDNAAITPYVGGS
jgi:hypothetical protein